MVVFLCSVLSYFKPRRQIPFRMKWLT